MIAKIWKKLLLFILLIACLFNIVIKIVNKSSLNQELQSSAQYIETQQKMENETTNTTTKKVQENRNSK